MYHYQIDFAKYKLKEYEQELAIREFQNQFPIVKNYSINDNGISFTVRNLVNELKLKKMTFFSAFHYQNSKHCKSNVFTNQMIIENYHKYSPNLFKESIPTYSREIRYLTHSLHEYKGRFYPQLAKALMNYAGLQKGDTILDPFCGSGTTLVESFLFGANAIGVDINPIATLVAKAKVKSLSLEERDFVKIKTLIKKIGNESEKIWVRIKLDDYNSSIDIRYLRNWFPENNLKKTIFIKESIATLCSTNSELLAKVVLSNLLRQFSFQDPSQLRIRRRKDHPPEDLIEAFTKNLTEQIQSIEKFQSHCDIELDSTIQTYLGDIRTLQQSTKLKSNQIDAVITSPPYATALPYVDTDRLSLFVFGYTDKNNFKQLEKSLIGNREITKSQRILLDKELEQNFETSLLPYEIINLLKSIYQLNKNADVGFRRKNTAALLFKYFHDMHVGIDQVSKVLKKNKYAFFVVGNNHTTAGTEKISIPTDDFIGLIAENNNFRLIEKIPMSVQKSYMIHSKNAIKTESILVLKRK